MKRLLLLLAGFVAVRLAVRRVFPRRHERIQGEVAVVTGSSRGLGFVLAEQLARRGARVVLCARDERQLARARDCISAIGGEVLAVPCDVGDRDQVQRLIAEATSRFGGVDILVNNAGIITVGPLETQTVGDFHESMDIMFWGTVHATMEVLPQMRRRGRGRIVNITSIGGKVSVPHLMPYNTAKFAAVGFSQGLHAEESLNGIDVLTVVPGLMRTGSHMNAFFKGNNRAEFSWFSLGASLPVTSIDVESAARQILDAMVRGQSELIITPQAHLLARVHGVAPGIVSSMLGIVNRVLPRAKPTQQQRVPGHESESTVSRSFLTVLGRNAAHAYQQMGAPSGDGSS